MTFDEFRESIRCAIVAGVWTVSHVVGELHRHGYNTTRDVPEDMRQRFLDNVGRCYE